MSRKEVSMIGNLTRDMMRDVMETSLKKPIQTGEFRKNPVEPAWRCPGDYIYELVPTEKFVMEYLKPKQAVTGRVVLQLHGGGYIGPMKNIYRRFAVKYSELGLGADVLTPDYRVAPEHPFPVPLHDVADAWQWLQANAEGLGLDPQRLAIGGDSAGGNLAAACCLLLRDLGLPQPCHQLLLYPALDAGMGSDSYRDYAHGYYLSAELMQRCWQAYLGDRHPPQALASPAHATDLHGLAPASVLSCEHDPLRDEAEQYARRLQTAGIDCTLERLPGMIHACIHLQGVAASTGMAVQRAGVLLRQALA